MEFMQLPNPSEPTVHHDKGMFFDDQLSRTIAVCVKTRILGGKYDYEHRILFESLIDPPWFFETVVNNALVKWGDKIRLGEIDVAIECCVRWMEHSGVLHAGISDAARHALADLIVRVAFDLQRHPSRTQHQSFLWN